MSLDDRDWYRDEMRERAGLKPKRQLWKEKRPPPVDVRHNPYFVNSTSRARFVVPTLVFILICLGTFGILKLLSLR